MIKVLLIIVQLGYYYSDIFNYNNSIQDHKVTFSRMFLYGWDPALDVIIIIGNFFTQLIKHTFI